MKQYFVKYRIDGETETLYAWVNIVPDDKDSYVTFKKIRSAIIAGAAIVVDSIQLLN